ncbi:glutaredoxin family protein [Streptacidiphilus sp. PB12-B1b]|uniref:glutaredoxin family protein n=1 Tax=Streptacidiphilus sp. PB12-B1b TaxID=2705012 RepID=UPI0015F8304D|nr:glutaredoxin family protein [Streptacidiphilus sp. PB12-B1b]QMU79519.1 glutaredoxin family protein [Streptacidiphilus sp. PB12-B1b]
MSPLLRRGAPRKEPSDHLVTLIGKPDCHLCDDARAVVARLAGELGFAWEEHDINQDEELYRKYWEQIPVTLVDGRQHDFWRVDERRLRTALGG